MPLWPIVALCAVAALWVLRRLLRIAAVGAGYKAKILGSGVFVSGRDPASVLAEDAAADRYGILRLFTAQVDRAAGVATASLCGLCCRRAVFRPGLGVTLTAGRADLERPSLPAAQAVPPGPWPVCEPAEPVAGPAGLAGVLERAFAEPSARRLRRTRAVLVAQGGRLLAERYAPGFGPAVPLSGWSMTKSVTGALVGILVGEGRLSLEARALLPRWSDRDDVRSRITLDDLLRMRGGLNFAEVYSDPLSDVTRMLFVSPDAAAFAAARPLRAAPGTTWAYASASTNIISRVMREAFASPQDYLAFPRRALFGPLGMGSATIEPDAAGTFVGSSFMYASARDWARFGQLYLQDGMWDGRRVLPEGWVAYSRSATPQSPDGRYGAHWWLKLSKDFGGQSEAARRLPPDAFHAMGHEGQALTVIPSLGLVAVRLGLSVHADAWNHAEFLAQVLDAL